MDSISRRSFVGAAGAAAAFTIIKPELVRGAGKEKLKFGLVGCGGRGTQAVVNLLNGNPEAELVAMGDLFQDHLDKAVHNLHDPKYLAGNARRPAGDAVLASIDKRATVEPGRLFVGFDAYKKVIDSGVDVVMLATPPGYRPAHFEYAVNAKKHVFCEKPFGTDPVGVRRFMAAVKKSEDLKLTVVTGAQRRFQRNYQETVQKIHDGAIGDVVAAYAYWIGTPVIQQKARDPKWSDMEFQHRAWYSFVWICGDQVVEQHLHNIDVCNWVMGAHPEKVTASGGAAWRPRDEIYGNIYDHIVSDFTYPNGVHMHSHGRQFRVGSEVPSGQPAYTNVSELVVGTKGRSKCWDLGTTKEAPRTATRDPLEDPYVREHIALCNSIRGDGPYINHGMQVAESTMTCIMARESAYSGREITWDDMMASQLDLQPKEFDIAMSLAVPPLPVPGVYRFI